MGLPPHTANALLNRVQVVPISSQVDRLYPAEAYVSLDGKRRKAMADQITQAANIVCSADWACSRRTTSTRSVVLCASSLTSDRTPDRWWRT